jgi:hypothetical protein
VEEVALQHAGDDLRRLGAARADQAEDAGDLPGIDREGRCCAPPAHGQVLAPLSTLPARRRACRLRAVELVRQAAADHRPDDAVAVEVRGVVGDDMLAVAQDGDAVGELQRLLQRMRDEDDRDAACLQAADQGEEVVLLLRRQRGGRLVEDDDPAFCRTARAISTICFLAAPSVATVAVGSTLKFSDCRNCCAAM